MIRFNKRYFLEDIIPFMEFKLDDRKYLINPEMVKYREIDNRKRKVFFDGHEVKISTSRLRMFLLKGHTCVTCKVEGLFLYKEKNSIRDGYHLNLYAVKDGLEILMTKDHILPKSLGGLNHIDNYQTMCTECNAKKGNDVTWQKKMISGECGSVM